MERALQEDGGASLSRVVLDTRVAGCISLLHALHQCSERPQPGHVVHKHAEKALALMRPKSKQNLETFAVIESRAARLQAHLSKARAAATLPSTILPAEPPSLPAPVG